MDVPRKLGILVFCGVPAIIGGGIIYAIFHSYIPVAIYLVMLFLLSGHSPANEKPVFYPDMILTKIITTTHLPT